MKSFRYWALALVWFCCAISSAFADAGQYGSVSLEKIEVKEKDDGARLNFAPLDLLGGSRLTLISATRLKPLVNRVSELLTTTHGQYSRLFGEIPPLTTKVRLLDPESFYRTTGAPRWTNAMYYRNEIILPVGDDMDLENLFRSVKHEYTHAVLNSLSNGRCPGWLDEGIAQWAEGSPNPALEPALKGWLISEPPVPLSLLQGGFTKLKTDVVPPAYAQSLFATNMIIKQHGFEGIKSYLKRLRIGRERDDAFKAAFGSDEKGFENLLGKELKRWSAKLIRQGSD